MWREKDGNMMSVTSDLVLFFLEAFLLLLQRLLLGFNAGQSRLLYLLLQLLNLQLQAVRHLQQQLQLRHPSHTYEIRVQCKYTVEDIWICRKMQKEFSACLRAAPNL